MNEEQFYSSPRRTTPKEQEPLMLEKMMQAVEQLRNELPPLFAPPVEPLTASTQTLEYIRRSIPELPEGARHFGIQGGISIEVDDTLPDGVIKASDGTTLCNIRPAQGVIASYPSEILLTKQHAENFAKYAKGMPFPYADTPMKVERAWVVGDDLSGQVHATFVIDQGD